MFQINCTSLKSKSSKSYLIDPSSGQKIILSNISSDFKFFTNNTMTLISSFYFEKRKIPLSENTLLFYYFDTCPKKEENVKDFNKLINFIKNSSLRKVHQTTTEGEEQ